MPDPQVTVVIPTHNRARLLPDALESVVAQSIDAAIEVAVVDDGSTDDTIDVMKPFLEAHGEPGGPVHITYTRLEKLGVVTARNTAIARTTAPLVAFLDSDDYWLPDKLAKQVAQLEDDPDVGVSHTGFRYVRDNGDLADDGPQRRDNPCAGDCLRTLLAEDVVIFSSVLMRRSLIERVAGDEAHGLPFDPRWTNAQDYDLLLRAAGRSTFAYLSEPLVRYRLHDQHGAMGNLPRAFGFHARVQIDFANRHGDRLGLSAGDGRDAARRFLLGRAEAMFWRRELDVARRLVEVARELDLADDAFDRLDAKLRWPRWMYRVKDRLDDLRGRAAQ